MKSLGEGRRQSKDEIAGGIYATAFKAAHALDRAKVRDALTRCAFYSGVAIGFDDNTLEAVLPPGL